MRSAPSTGRVAAAALPPPSAHERRVGVQHRHQLLDAAGADGVPEAPHDFLRFTARHGETPARLLQPAARAREDLPRVRGALVDGLRDVVEVELEHLAQQEDRALGRRQPLQQDEECRGQRRRQRGRFLIRFGQRFRQPGTWIHHASPLCAAQMVDAQPRDDGREVRPRRTDVGVLVLARPEPRVLHDVLGFAGAAEHPVRNREQQRSMCLERRRVPVSLCHGSGCALPSS